RADPKLFRRQRNGDVHLTLLELELHLFNAPGRSQTEQFGVESLVVHDWLPPGTMPDENLAPPRRRSARELSHTKSGRGQEDKERRMTIASTVAATVLAVLGTLAWIQEDAS